jgi:glucose/arabinose dehydrogenase
VGWTLLLALAVFLGGCEGAASTASPTTTATASPSPTPAATPTPYPLPARGGRNPSHLVSADESVRFERGVLSGVVTSTPTTLAFGPDGRLYVAQLDGRILALTLDGQRVVATEVITTPDELGDVLGIAFDPLDPPEPVTVYVSDTYVFREGAPAFGGKIARLKSPDFEVEHIITGLPATEMEHATNGLAFDAEGRLYIAQAGTTNAGVPGEQLVRPETPLSSAILVAGIGEPAFDGVISYDTRDPLDTTNQLGGDVRVFASGLRNPYDVVVHSNGRVYATDNGPNPGEGLQSSTCATEGEHPWAPDELNLIVDGAHYGHPNRNRGRSDPRQCTYAIPDTAQPGVTRPIATLGRSTSANGIAEYTSDAFDGALQGELIYVEWVKGRIWRVRLSVDGSHVEAIRLLAFGTLDEPVDVTVGPDGTVYVAELGADRITYFRPAEE